MSYGLQGISGFLSKSLAYGYIAGHLEEAETAGLEIGYGIEPIPICGNNDEIRREFLA